MIIIYKIHKYCVALQTYLKTQFLSVLSTCLFADYVIQVRNADISFDKRDLIHLFGKRPLLDVVFDAHVIVRCRPALRNEHLLWEEKRWTATGRQTQL